MSFIIEEYIRDLKVRGYRDRSLEGATQQLHHFTHWLINQGILDITDVTKQKMEQYRKHLTEKRNTKTGNPLSPQTINEYLTGVKGHLKWLYKKGLIAQDPSAHLEYLKVPKKLPGLVLTDRQIKKLLNHPDLHSPLGYRNRAILELLYSTGIRRNELMGLNIEDIDFSGGHIRILQGKGGKDRIVPIGKIAIQYLENYIKGIRPLLIGTAKNERALFISERSRRLSDSGINEIIRIIGKQTDIEGLTPHVFRRSCATGMIRNKANPYYIKEILGHESLDSLAPYLKLTITDLKEVHSKCHPRERQMTEDG